MKSSFKLIVALFLFALSSQAQPANFSIAIEPYSIPGLGGLQAFAKAQSQGKWLIVGGRLDGLHRRQPWATFDVAGNNNQLLVVDPINQLEWSSPLTSLPVSIQEQLQSTNMEFYQEGDYLYLVGGYGFSATAGDHITYPNLTSIKVSDVILGIINNTSITPYFRQIVDQDLAITGGYMNKIYDDFYITGGQRFDGRYNPMNNPTFTQTYTNAIRRFQIIDNGINLSINTISVTIDSLELHRRDYNVVPQIMPNGEQGLTAFSGVFLPTVDLPYTNCVNIDSNGYSVNNNFTQLYNQYHCAHIPLYSLINNEMHTLFFGGIAQYYDSLGIMVQDNNVPFVKTIAMVTRDSNGLMVENKLPVELPDYFGASSEFFVNTIISTFSNEVIQLDSLNADTNLLGYIFGGIKSSAPNIFWINDGTQSIASETLFKVYLIKNTTSIALEPGTIQGLNLNIFPNPNNGTFQLSFDLKNASEVAISITDVLGRSVFEVPSKYFSAGKNKISGEIKNTNDNQLYIVTLKTKDSTTIRKFIVHQE
ncbi:MAG TPA: T9SS type A sorting domain-containing protein [Bacteroidia bacterium]|jgi:hypothetical protein|nr:T9SS type A sorting domain-containing protein [Bacteroidia bacterium]HQF29376.1 T9SS type A sorting domain-containing protein [Bacteroidia bacterium]HQK98792.1 T9SS type A sorting domain-containing protein [Bacteroidia bacterium]